MPWAGGWNFPFTGPSLFGGFDGCFRIHSNETKGVKSMNIQWKAILAALMIAAAALSGCYATGRAVGEGAEEVEEGAEAFEEGYETGKD